MKISRFKTDPALEVEGVWVDIGDGAELLVARLGNPRHRKISKVLARPYQAQLRSRKGLDEKVATALAVDAMAHTILLGWKGIEDEAGEPLEYSVETAKAVLTDSTDFRDLVMELADEMETFRSEELEESLGNSSSASSGGKPGGRSSKR